MEDSTLGLPKTNYPAILNQQGSINMQNYQQRLNQLYSEIDEIAADRLKVMARIGQTLYREHPSLLEGGEFRELLPQIDAQNDEIARIVATVKRIEEIGERIKALSLERSDKEERREKMIEELRPHHTLLGEIAFRVFKENPVIDNKYTEIFRELSENYDEVRQLERDLAKLRGEQAKPPFVERLMKRGRDLLLKSRIQGKQEKRDALYEEAGRKLAETDFIDLIDDPELDEAAAPFEEKRREITQVDREISEIDQEIRKLNEEQREKSGGKRIQKAIADLREARRQREESQQELFSQVGRRYVEGESGKGEQPESIAGLIEELATTNSREQACREAIERFEAAISFEKLSHRIRQTGEEKERQQRKLEKIEQSIRELEGEIAGLEEERRKAEALRGPTEELENL